MRQVFAWVHPKGKIVGLTGYQSTRTTSGPGRENTTVLLAASASGAKLPPLVIFQGKYLWNEWMYKNENVNNAYTEIFHLNRQVIGDKKFDALSLQKWKEHIEQIGVKQNEKILNEETETVVAGNINTEFDQFIQDEPYQVF